MNIEEIKNRVKSSCLIDEKTKCWNWAKAIDSTGYAKMWPARWNSGLRSAHRFSYLVFNGKIGNGLHLDHLCKNRKCINPDHLEAVTPAENNKRADAGKLNRMKTHCPHGHEYTKENTRIYKGKRHCRKCNLKQTHKRRYKC